MNTCVLQDHTNNHFILLGGIECSKNDDGWIEVYFMLYNFLTVIVISKTSILIYLFIFQIRESYSQILNPYKQELRLQCFLSS